MRIFDLILELIYPKRCIICGEILDYGTEDDICGNCTERAEYATDIDFKKAAEENIGEKPYFDNCNSVFYYDYVKFAVEHFKFKGYKKDAVILGRIMYEYGVENNIFDDIDFMVSVPIHKSRYRKRGFNHAFELAKEIGKHSGIKAYDDYLKRVKKTKPQYMLKVDERRENIKDAFEMAESKNVKGRKILLIDDIFTTGGTVNECAAVLKKNGAEKVDVFTLSVSALNRKEE